MVDFRDEGIFSTDQIAALIDMVQENSIHWPIEELGTAPNHSQKNRIEALRAASRVAGAAYREAELRPTGNEASDYTLHLAAHFTEWLETGKR